MIKRSLFFDIYSNIYLNNQTLKFFPPLTRCVSQKYFKKKTCLTIIFMALNIAYFDIKSFYWFTCLILFLFSSVWYTSKKEIELILKALNKHDKCCELDRLKEKNIVVHQEYFNNIFETLALGFEESSDIMAEMIRKELIMVKTFTEFFSW